MSASKEIYRELICFWEKEYNAHYNELKDLIKALNNECIEQIAKDKILKSIHESIMQKNKALEMFEYYEKLYKEN